LLALTLGLTAGTARAAFENVSVSPRSRAMGDAGVAVADDAFASYLNPAAMAGLSHNTLGSSYVRPFGLAFTDLVYFGGALPISPKAGTIGFGFRHFGVSYEGSDLLKESTFTVSHGISLYSDIHSTVNFGYSLNVYRLEFGPTVGSDGQGTDGFNPGDDTALGLDLALLIVLHERTRLGLLAKNVNIPQIGEDNEEIPQRIQGGIAYEPYLGVVTTFEIESQLGEEVMYHGGLEMEVADSFRLRFGVQTAPNKLTAGFGYGIEGFSLEYGFSTGGGVLDSSHQFGLTYSWGGETE
jgi:hypothetical protein